jgi:hypothetical protein
LVGCAVAFGQRIARHPRIPDRRHIPKSSLYPVEFLMSKIRNGLMGLVVMGAAVGLAATPAQAESKVAQCKRFDQAMNSFSQPITSLRANPSSNPKADGDRLLKIMSTELKKLLRHQFSDPKIRGFQQSALNIYVKLHDDFADLADAAERGDQATAKQSYQQLFTAIKPSETLYKQFTAYCGKPK